MRISKRRLQLLLLIACIPIGAAVLARSHVLERFREAPVRLEVSLSARQMKVIEGGEVVQTYGVAVGRASNPTPTGTFRTGKIVWNPGWTPPPSDWARNMKSRSPGDPRNPMQGVKIYFKAPWYFIHGTNDPGSIGQAASRGCIRMTPGAATSLAKRIEQAGGSVPLVITS
ncbi:MAG: L,D-transpeptidase [Longimicrobiales bacterium]